MGNAASGQNGKPSRGRPAVSGSSVLTPPTGIAAVPDLGSLIPAQRHPDDVRPVTPPPVAVDPCACGHGRAAHDHFRPGHDCGACGAAGCAEFRAEGGRVRRTLRRFGLSS